MNKEVKDFRKVAELAGRRTNVFGEVLNDNCKYFSSRYDKNMECYRDKYSDKVKELCNKWNIDSVRVLSTTKWIGDYGMIWNQGSSYINDKFIYRYIRTLYDVNVSEKYWYVDEYNNYYYVPGGYKIVEDCLIKMSNGQYFDTDSWYYFSMDESFELTRLLKQGYKYYNSQSYLYDYYDQYGEGCPE
jgi:hypothetical protein